MKANKICAYEAGKVKLEEYELLEPGVQEVLVETVFSMVSPGTELAWINHMENTPGEYPYYPGYSCCGRIREKGNGVETFHIGDIIVCNQIHCSAFVIPSVKCTKVPENVEADAASVFRLASISLQGVRKADIQIGDQVAVLGLGPIGNFAVQLAYTAGAGEVTGFDFLEWRRKLGKKCGILKVEKDGEKYQNKFDVVIEATGVPQAVNTALKMVKPLGKVVLLGSTRGNTDHVNFYRDVHKKGIHIIGAHEMYRAKDEEDVFGHFRTHKKDEETIISLLAQKRIKSKALISETVRPEEAQNIYNRLLKKEEHLMLVAFKWGEN